MKKYFLLSLFFFSVICISRSLAFGMASDYLPNNTIYLDPGESREYHVELQNSKDSEVNVLFDLTEGIANLKDKQDTYLVGGKNPIVTLMLLIYMPKNAEPGQVYSVKFSAIPLPTQNTSVNLNIKLNKEIYVIAKGEKKNILTPGNYLLVIGLFFTLAIVFALIYKKNKLLTGRLQR